MSLEAQHLVRYWRAEMGCGEDGLRAAVAAVGTIADDVRRYLARQCRVRPPALATRPGVQP